jgi:hypothetical protein
MFKTPKAPARQVCVSTYLPATEAQKKVPKECCQQFPWNLAANRQLRETACLAFGVWYGQNERYYDLGWRELSVMYGSPLIEKLAMVFAAGRLHARNERKLCTCLQFGTTAALLEVQENYPDLFRAFSLTQATCMETLRTIFLLGWFSV